jgi:hypothetical protein
MRNLNRTEASFRKAKKLAASFSYRAAIRLQRLFRLENRPTRFRAR